MKKFFAICLIAIASVSLFAGGSSESTEVRELNVLLCAEPQIHEKEYLQNIYFPEFTERTGIKVNVDFVPQADGQKKIQTEQESGNIVTDVLYVHTGSITPFIDNGWVQDITEVINESGSTFTTMFDGTTNKDGRRYFMPNVFDVYMVIANVKALDYLPEGVTKEDVIEGITWEQYADWAVNIAEATGEGKTMLPASQTGSQLLYPMGGMCLSYGGGFPEFNTDAAKESYKILAKIAAADGFYPEQDQYSGVSEPMLADDVWLAFSHMTPAGEVYNSAPNNYVIGAAPSGSAGAGSTAGAWCFGIQTGAKNQDEAEEFLKYAANPEVNYQFCVNNGGFLSPIHEAEEFITDEDVIIQTGLAVLDKAIVAGVPSTSYTDWNAVKIQYTEVLDEIIRTKAVPSDEYLDAMQAELEALKK